MKIKTNAEVLASLVQLKDRKVADIGCGEGGLVRLMTKLGASVTGVECNSQMLQTAQAQDPIGPESYVAGVGEDMPFGDDTLDLVVFFNSLHHVDMARQPTALAEAARVLHGGGQVYVCEPVAEGSHFEMMRPVHDETGVRACAYRAIKAAVKLDLGLSQENETTYINTSSYPDFAALRHRLCAINPHLTNKFAAQESKISALFQDLGQETATGVTFEQPMRVNLLRKIS
ncbi:MAG TPA: class I SAM-dependent methyltransferase [Rhodospirillales bacterium]|nr:class I SAM-dependent methyltransferase [Rhodospirillales bacterium]